MWEVKIEMPVEVNIGPDHWVDTGEIIELILVCEPDESVGDTTYWISAVGLDAFEIEELGSSRKGKKPSRYWLARNHPLHQRAIYHARHDLKLREVLNDHWAKWLDDKPARRWDARSH